MSPCYNCNSRMVGCHGACPRYLVYKQSENEKKQQRANDPITGYIIRKAKERREALQKYAHKHSFI